MAGAAAGDAAVRAVIRLAGVMLLLALACLPPASAAETPAAGDLQQGVTGQAQQLLAGVSPDGALSDSLQRLVQNSEAEGKTAWQNALRLLTQTAVAVLLCSGLRGVRTQTGSAAEWAERLTGTVIVSLTVLTGFHSAFAVMRDALTQISSFSAVLQPVLAAALAMGGYAGTATLVQVASVFALDVLIRLITLLFLPGVCVFLALLCADAAAGDGAIGRMAKLLREMIAGALKLLLTIFVAYLGVGGGIAGNVDKIALKTAKFAVSGAVPVVGGVLSEAAELMLSGATVLKGSIGIFGLLCVTAVCLLPFLKAGAYYLCFKLGTALLAPIADARLLTLLEGFGSGFGLLLGILGTCSAVLYLELLYAVLMVKMI